MQVEWIDIRKKKPRKGIKVLACDSGGYVDRASTEDRINNYAGRLTWLEAYKRGNGREIVAWMPILPFPADLCDPDADGEMPRYA